MAVVTRLSRTARSELALDGNRCLAALGAAAVVGVKLGIGECNGANTQKWEFAGNGALTINGLCLDAPANGQPELAACDVNRQSQRWSFSQ